MGVSAIPVEQLLRSTLGQNQHPCSHYFTLMNQPAAHAEEMIKVEAFDSKNKKNYVRRPEFFTYLYAAFKVSGTKPYFELAQKLAQSKSAENYTLHSPDGALLKYDAASDSILIVKEGTLVFIVKMDRRDQYQLDPPSTQELFLRMNGEKEGPFGLKGRVFIGQSIQGAHSFDKTVLNKRFEKHRVEFIPPIESAESYEAKAKAFLEKEDPYQIIQVFNSIDPATSKPRIAMSKVDLRTFEEVNLYQDSKGDMRISSYLVRSSPAGIFNYFFVKDEQFKKTN